MVNMALCNASECFNMVKMCTDWPFPSCCYVCKALSLPNYYSVTNDIEPLNQSLLLPIKAPNASLRVQRECVYRPTAV